jgi:hypothetical protein
MSRAEVEEILGQPGDYTTGPTSINEQEGVLRSVERIDTNGVWICWATDEAKIMLFIDFYDHTLIKTFEHATRERQAPIDNILWRVRRQWRKWFGG